MKKLDATVVKETKYIAAWTLIFSVLMEAVFLILGKWNITVLLGNLLTGTAGVLNFLLMGIAVQRAVTKEEKEARDIMKVSHRYRLLLLLGVTVLGVALPCFHTWAVIPPLFFTRVAIMLRPLFNRKES